MELAFPPDSETLRAPAMTVPPWITLSLTTGSAFAAAWFIARREVPEGAGQSRHVSGIAEAASAREVQAAAAGKEKAASPSAGVLLDTRLREALAMTDLAAAIKHIMAHEGEDHCADTRLICLIEQLPAARLAELPAALAAHMGNDYIVRFVLSAWAERDAASALAWVQATPALNASGTRAFLTGWMRAAPEAALAWLDAQPLSTISDNLRTAAVEAMAEKNPAAALEMMQARGWTERDPGAVLRLLSNWGGSDPVAALSALRTLHSGMGLTLEPEPEANRQFSSKNLAFRTMLQALLYGAFQRSPSDAAALLASLSPEELSAGSDVIAGEIFARDPEAGEALFTARPDENTRQLLLSLASQNPATVLSNLGRLEEASLRQELLRALGSSYFSSDMKVHLSLEAQGTVRETLEGMSDPEQKSEAAQKLCAMTAASSPAWAAELWQGLSVKSQVFSAHEFMTEAGKVDPQTVLNAWSSSSPEMQSQSLKSLCYALGASAPDAALPLVLQRNEPAWRAECAATLFAVWSARDEAAAFAALERHSDQLDYSAIMSALTRAGDFAIAVQTEGGAAARTSDESVNTAKLQIRLQQMLGQLPANP